MTLKEKLILPTEDLSLQGSEIRLHTFPGEKKPEEYLVITDRAAISLCCSLAQKIEASGFRPDVVIPIIRGGSIPARYKADLLGNLPEVPITVASGYDVDGTRFPPEIIQGLPPLEKTEEKLRKLNKFAPGQRIENILVVEEVADSGDSLEKVFGHIKQEWGIEQTSGRVKVCSLVVKEKGVTNIRVDFYELTTSAWVIYPWEVRESIEGLVRLWKNSETPLSDAEIKERLKELGFSEVDFERYWPEKEG